MARLLGIDVGTSSCKVVLLDEHGNLIRQATRSYPLSIPRPMWSEQNPEDWWQGVVECLKDIDESKPDAIGLTGQMHGAVFLDADGKVIRPAILWNDQRTAEECQEIDQTVGGERYRDITGNPPLTGFQLPKILWLRNHELSNYQKLSQVLLPKDFIRYKLTGMFATDLSDASGVGLLNLANRSWSGELLSKLDLDARWFPKVLESDLIAGHTLEGLPIQKGIPVVAGAGDQAAGAVGCGAVEPGIMSVSLGTSGVVFVSLDRPQPDPSGAAHVFCHANRAWHAMGVMLSCGGALKWFRDTFAPGESYDRLGEWARESPVGAEGLTFAPYLAGERCPHNDPTVRGAFLGLTLAHDRRHLSRAVFEGVTFGLLDAKNLLESLGASAGVVRVTGGGAKGDFWLQLLSDVFEVPCVRMEVDEGPAVGVALLAGVGIGIWEDVKSACKAVVRTAVRVTPNNPVYSSAYQRFRRSYPHLSGMEHGL